MKNKSIIRFYVIFGGIALFTLSCNNNNCNSKYRPETIKPIDWEGYNDVSTVFWTYYATRDCSEKWRYEDTAKHIKIFGLLDYNLDTPRYFKLRDSNGVTYRDEILGINYPTVTFSIVDDSEVIKMIIDKFTSANLTEKMYVRGKIPSSIGIIPICSGDGSNCCAYTVNIIIFNSDDVYFEFNN